MKDRDDLPTGLGFVLIPLLLVACCAGLPAIAAAALSVAAIAWVGGITVGAITFVIAAVLLWLRRRARRGGFPIQPERRTR